MSDYEVKKITFPTQADLSYCSLESGIKLFKEEFGINPEILTVCIEDILTAVWFENVKSILGINYIRIDREFPKYYWELYRFDEKKKIKCIFYSEGT